MAERTRLLETQREVDEVVDIMKDNLDNVLKRDDKLDELERRSYQVRNEAEIFKKNAKVIKRKMWWKNKKMCFILVVIVLVLIAALIVWLAALK